MWFHFLVCLEQKHFLNTIFLYLEFVASVQYRLFTDRHPRHEVSLSMLVKRIQKWRVPVGYLPSPSHVELRRGTTGGSMPPVSPSQKPAGFCLNRTLASKIVFLQVPGAFGTKFGFLSRSLSQCTGTVKAAHTNSEQMDVNFWSHRTLLENPDGRRSWHQITSTNPGTEGGLCLSLSSEHSSHLLPQIWPLTGPLDHRVQTLGIRSTGIETFLNFLASDTLGYSHQLPLSITVIWSVFPDTGLAQGSINFCCTIGRQFLAVFSRKANCWCLCAERTAVSAGW